MKKVFSDDICLPFSPANYFMMNKLYNVCRAKSYEGARKPGPLLQHPVLSGFDLNFSAILSEPYSTVVADKSTDN